MGAYHFVPNSEDSADMAVRTQSSFLLVEIGERDCRMHGHKTTPPTSTASLVSYRDFGGPHDHSSFFMVSSR